MGRGSGRDYLTVDPGSRRAWSVVVISVVTASTAILSGSLFGAGHVVYAFAVPFGILFGNVGALGFALGGLFLDLITTRALPVVLVQFTSDGIFVLVGAAVWGSRPLPNLDHWRTLPAGIGTYLSAAFVAVACSVAWFLATGPLLTTFSFVPAVPVLFTDRVVTLLVLGPLVLVAAAAMGGTHARVSHCSRRLIGRDLAVVALSSLWLGGAFVLGLVHHDVGSIPSARQQFAVYLPTVVEPVALAIVAELYPVVQACLALLFGTLLVVVFDRW
jgi:hypothetical protein